MLPDNLAGMDPVVTERLMVEANALKTEAEMAGLETDHNSFIYKVFQVAENPYDSSVRFTDEEIEKVWAYCERLGFTNKESIGSHCQRIYHMHATKSNN